MTPEQFEKLPRYAKDEITRLRANLAHAQETMYGLASGLEGAILVDPYERKIRLPSRERIRWEFNPNTSRDHIDVYADSKDPSLLYAQAGDTLLIQPMSSNMFCFRVAPRSITPGSTIPRR